MQCYKTSVTKCIQ